MSVTLEVLRAVAPVLIQDGGRPGHLAEGVPPGGALIPELLGQSNLALGNAWAAAALEGYGDLELEARTEGLISVDGEVRSFEAGERFLVERPSRWRARYVAVPGGIDVPVRLGSRSTLALAGLGGFEGRPLRRGDVLQAIGQRADGVAATVAPSEWSDPARPIRILPGPDLEAFAPEALAVLAESSFVVSPSSDRVGTRLLGGPRLPRLGGDAGLSTPMLCGAIQVPTSGEPIILGPDHPTVGGYPVIGVVVQADRGAVFARRPGAEVRFSPISLEEGRKIEVEWRQRWARDYSRSDLSGA